MKNRGLSFLEMLIALMIFSIAMLGYFQIFNVALNSQLRTKQEIIGVNLARALMSEILTKDFHDPDAGHTADLGPNGGEGRHDSIDPFDDIDDYNLLTETTPMNIAGDDMDGTGGTPDYSDFSRSVTVEFCEIDGSNNIICPPEVETPPTKLKKVIVTVTGSYFADFSVEGYVPHPP